MRHPDEGTIHAWLDGALSEPESVALESHVASCAECAAAVAEARGLLAGASRVLSALDDVPGGVIPRGRTFADVTEGAREAGAAGATDVSGARSRRWTRAAGWRIAASLLVVAGGSALIVRGGGIARMEPVADRATSREVVMEAPVAATATSPVATAPAAASVTVAAPEAVERRAARAEGAMGDAFGTGSGVEASVATPAPPPPPAAVAAREEVAARQRVALGTAAPAPRRLAMIPAPDTLAVAQHEQPTVVGTVTDEETGAPVMGASVSIDGTTLGTITDELGRFAITGATIGEHRADVRRIGYGARKQEIRVAPDSGAEVHVALSRATTQLAAQAVTERLARAEDAPASALAQGAARAGRPGSRTEKSAGATVGAVAGAAASAVADAIAPSPVRPPWVARPEDACLRLTVRPAPAATVERTPVVALSRELLVVLRPEVADSSGAGAGFVARLPRSGDARRGARATWNPGTRADSTETLRVHVARADAGVRLHLEWRDGSVQGTGSLYWEGGRIVRPVTARGDASGCGAR